MNRNPIFWAVMALIVWWAGVTAFWYNDMRLAAVVLATVGVVAIGGAAVAWGKKVVNALR